VDNPCIAFNGNREHILYAWYDDEEDELECPRFDGHQQWLV